MDEGNREQELKGVAKTAESFTGSTLAFVLHPPNPFRAPGGEVELQEHLDRGVHVTVLFTGFFRLRVVATLPTGRRITTIFRPLLVRPRGGVRVAIALDADGTATAYVRGALLHSDPFMKFPPLVVAPQVPHHSLPDSIPVLPVQTEARDFVDALFYRTLLDLQERAKSADWYTLLRCAHLLRQLLLDPPLVHQVKRSYSEVDKLRFRVNLSEPLQLGDIGPTVQLGLLDPIGEDGEEVSLDRFLAAPAMKLGDEVVSTKDLIRACANSKGGVHFDNAKPKEKAVIAALAFDEVAKLQGLSPTLHSLIVVSRITLIGLKPLATAVANRMLGAPTR